MVHMVPPLHSKFRSPVQTVTFRTPNSARVESPTSQYSGDVCLYPRIDGGRSGTGSASCVRR